MSKALLKGELDKEFRSLEEVDKKENKRKKQLKDLRKYVSTNKHGVKKSLKRLQAKNGNTNASKSSKKIATAVNHPDETNIANENVRKLLIFSNPSKVSVNPTGTIIDHTMKTKRYYEPKCRTFLKNLKPEKKVEPTSIFSENDFEKFSKEYFLNSNPISRATLEKKKEKELN